MEQDLQSLQRGRQQSTAVAENSERAIREVESQVAMAKRFPRDMVEVERRIIESCQRRRLAECAEYEYPRGGEMVRGESVRLVEVIAQEMTNIDYGIRELDSHDGYSEVEVYAWDMERNVRSRKVYRVKHWRDTKKGGYALTDSRDVYEAVANFASRRLRATLSNIIPRDLIDLAREQCAKTLAHSSGGSLEDRRDSMVEAFRELEVTTSELEAFLGHKLEAVTEREFLKLRRVYQSIKDGMGKVEDYFGTTHDARPTNRATEKPQERRQESSPTSPQGEGESQQGEEQAPQEGQDQAPVTPEELRNQAAQAKTLDDLDEVEDLARQFSGGEKAGITRAVNERRRYLEGKDDEPGEEGGQQADGFGGLD